MPQKPITNPTEAAIARMVREALEAQLAAATPEARPFPATTGSLPPRGGFPAPKAQTSPTIEGMLRQSMLERLKFADTTPTPPEAGLEGFPPPHNPMALRDAALAARGGAPEAARPDTGPLREAVLAARSGANVRPDPPPSLSGQPLGDGLRGAGYTPAALGDLEHAAALAASEPRPTSAPPTPSLMDRISRAVKDAPGRIASAVEAADIRGPVRTPTAATPDHGFFFKPGPDIPDSRDPGFVMPMPDTPATRDPGIYLDDIVDAGMAEELPARSPARPTPPPPPAPAASSGRLSPGLAATPTSKAPAPKAPTGTPPPPAPAASSGRLSPGLGATPAPKAPTPKAAPTGTPTFDKVSKDQIFAIKAMIPPTNAANAKERTAKVLRILEASPEVIMDAFGYPRTAEGLANARTWLPTPGEPASVTEQKTGALLAAVSGLDSGPPVRTTPAPAGPTSGRLSPGFTGPTPTVYRDDIVNRDAADELPARSPVTSAAVPRARTAFNPPAAPAADPSVTFNASLEETKRRFEAATGHTIKVISQRRTPEQQARLYSQGRSSPGPIVTELDGTKKKSKHQTGEAVDVMVINKAGKPVKADRKLWATFGEAAKSAGLVWGGDWKSLYDPGHIQLGTVGPPEPKPQPK